VAVGRGIWIGIAVALVAIIAVSSYVALYYPKGNASVNQTSNSHTTNPTQSIQESGTISLVDSEGGHFSIAKVTFCPVGIISGIVTECTDAQGTMWVSLSSAQSARLKFGQDLEISITYVPLQRVLFDTFGKVISITTDEANIALLNPNATEVIPVNWNPQLGDEVILTLNTETETPLVVITGLQSQAWTSQFSAVVNGPSCLGSSTPPPPPCVMIANGAGIEVSMTLYYPCNFSCSVSVTTSDSAFTISDFQQSTALFGQQVSFVLTIPNSDHVGDIHLSFVSIPS
jgi:hypothetical protein